jgi:hypothetical protein
VVFDDGDHAGSDRNDPCPVFDRSWSVRVDPSPTGRAGLEVRTHGLLRRVLVIAHLDALRSAAVSMKITHIEQPVDTTLVAVAPKSRLRIILHEALHGRRDDHLIERDRRAAALSRDI